MSCTCKYGAGLAGVCGFCKYRKATNKRLEKLEKSATLLDEAYAQGVADERARVVADLRKQNQLVYPSARFEAVRHALVLLANRYERGKHEEKP